MNSEVAIWQGNGRNQGSWLDFRYSSLLAPFTSFYMRLHTSSVHKEPPLCCESTDQPVGRLKCDHPSYALSIFSIDDAIDMAGIYTTSMSLMSCRCGEVMSDGTGVVVEVKMNPASI